MIPDWEKNSYFRSLITIIVPLVLLVFLCTGAEAADITVTSLHRDVSLSFGETADNTAYTSFTITNNENTTAAGNIRILSTPPPHISITGPSTFTCAPYSSTTVNFDIIASPSSSGEDETHTFEIDIGAERVTITVTIKYYAKIVVSPASIDFGTVNRHDSPSKTVTISEVYGYKDVTATISRTSGNDWVTVIPSSSFSIPKGSSRDVTFQLSPGYPTYNDYAWTYSLSTDVAGAVSIKIDAYILMPPRLGYLDDKSLTISFDKRRGTQPTYERIIDLTVRNDGDETMYFETRVIRLPSGINIQIDNPSGSVPGKSRKTVKLRIIAFYDAAEGEHPAAVRVDAGSAGQKDADISVKIKWPVGLVLSHANIDFGSLEFKDGGYEKRAFMITLTEIYDYKSVKRIALSKSGVYSGWLEAAKEDDFEDIPPGASRTVTIAIQPGLEAVPGPYTWDCDFISLNAAKKPLHITAKIVPINISMARSEFENLRRSELAATCASADTALRDAIYILDQIERGDASPSPDDWEKLVILIRSTADLITTLDKAYESLEGGFFDEAVRKSVAAWVISDTIASHSEIEDRTIRPYTTDIRDRSSDLVDDFLRYEVDSFTTNAYEMRESVSEAAESGDITGLKAGEDANNAARSYRNAEIIYRLLGDEANRRAARYGYDDMVVIHDDLVSDAGHLRFTSEKRIATTEEEDFTAIGNRRLLLNPYNYDTASQGYKTAISNLEDASKKYRIAGETLLLEETDKEISDLKSTWFYIFMLFLIVSLAYAFLLCYVTLRIIKGTVHYLADIKSEIDLGDFLIR